MKSLSSRIFALTLALGGIATTAVADQQLKRAESMNITVTVDPTCTVAVKHGEREPDGAIGLACRNFRQGQPKPLLLKSEPRDGHDVAWIRF